MILHWEKGWPAISDDDDICIEWEADGEKLWFDINKNGTFSTLRKYEDGRRIEENWANASSVFTYVEQQLREIFGP